MSEWVVSNTGSPPKGNTIVGGKYWWELGVAKNGGRWGLGNGSYKGEAVHDKVDAVHYKGDVNCNGDAVNCKGYATNYKLDAVINSVNYRVLKSI